MAIQGEYTQDMQNKGLDIWLTDGGFAHKPSWALIEDVNPWVRQAMIP